MLHAPGGVDARREHIANRACGDGLRAAAAGLNQRAQTQTRRVLHRRKAHDHQTAVFPAQGHDVRDGAEAVEVAPAARGFLLTAQQDGGQLEGHAHAGKVGVRVGAVGPVGVDDRGAVGQALLTFMVVGDDERHAELLAVFGLVQRGDAAVDGDDQPHALGGKLPDGGIVQAVALLQTAGDMGRAVRAQRAQALDQQAGGGDAVDVVVAEYGDLRAVRDSLLQQRGSRAEFLHGQRIAQRRRRVKLLFCVFRGNAAPAAQHAGRQRGKARPLQALYFRFLRPCNVPDSVLHSKYTS